jgi:hypothetical protein
LSKLIRGYGRQQATSNEKLIHAFSILTLAPSATFLKTLASAVIFPITFTALAGRTSFPRLTGVGPKKMQKALPLGQ